MSDTHKQRSLGTKDSGGSHNCPSGQGCFGKWIKSFFFWVKVSLELCVTSMVREAKTKPLKSPDSVASHLVLIY